MGQAAFLKIGQAFGGFFERVVIIVCDPRQHGRIALVALKGVQLLHGRLLHHTARCLWRITVPQQLDRMTEGHAFDLAHKADDIAAFAASAEAVPQVLISRDDKARRLIVMERTTAPIVLAALCQLHACDLGEANQAHFGLNALDL